MPHDPRSQGIKKSEFLAQTTIPSDAFFDFVAGQTNIRISVANLLTALGVTGTLVQAGDPLGTPVLDKQANVNKIRNIEAKVGIAASVSAQNGLIIKTALLPSGSGNEVLINETTAPLFRSLVEGVGIDITIVGTTIVITKAPTQIIAEVTANYQVLVAENIIHATGTFNVTLPNIAVATQEVTVRSISGTITLLGDATIEAPTSLTTGVSATLYPAGGQWWQK